MMNLNKNEIIYEIKNTVCVLCIIYLFAISTQTVACSTLDDFCQIDKRFQRVSDMSTAEKELANDLLLQRICDGQDTIIR